MATAERLRKLRRLAVAHTLGDLADGQVALRQQLRRAVHPHVREVLTERRPADLGERALQLPARRGHAARDVVQCEIVGVLGMDDRRRVFVEAGPEADCRRALHLKTCTRGEGNVDDPRRISP